MDDRFFGLAISLIGAILASTNGTYMNLDFRGIGIFLVIIGVILIFSSKK